MNARFGDSVISEFFNLSLNERNFGNVSYYVVTLFSRKNASSNSFTDPSRMVSRFTQDMMQS